MNIINLDDKRPKKVAGQKIKVGKKSEGYAVVKALQPLFNLGWYLAIKKGKHQDVLLELYNPDGEIHAYSEGNSFSVAARRMSVGFSNQFSNMQE